MIEIKNLTKKIGDNTIIDNITFSVKKGEVLGFLGPNGAGKTTTMKILTTFWNPSSGSVVVNGKELSGNQLAARSIIGYLPEMVPLYDDLMVFEYLKFIGEIRGIKKSDIIKRIKELVVICGLEKVIKKPIDELSKGYRQRVGLAQAIMHNPEILILDEPTTGLDPNQIAEIRDLIKKLGQEKTVIFSTHILGEVSLTCDRAIIINNGKIVGEGKPSELSTLIKSQDLIYIKIKGPKEEVEKKLNQLDNIDKVIARDKEAENSYGYEITPRPGIDLREELSSSVARSGWIILELYKKSTNLEDVFRELTK